jgi:hypothetical protein
MSGRHGPNNNQEAELTVVASTGDIKPTLNLTQTKRTHFGNAGRLQAEFQETRQGQVPEAM